MKRLVVHVGLPKTATTFLQSMIFPKVFGNAFLNWENSEELIRKFQSYYRSGSNVSKLAELIGNHEHWRESDDALLLSNENISFQIVEIWNGSAIKVDEFVDRTSALQNELKGCGISLSLAFVSRSQPEWLASRYAESAKRHDYFSQAHFEGFIRSNAFLGAIDSSLLCYKKLREAVRKSGMDDEFLVLSYEDFVVHKEHFINKLMSFVCGANFNKDQLNDILSEISFGSRVNSLGAGEGRWRLKNAKGVPDERMLVLTGDSKLYLDSLFG